MQRDSLCKNLALNTFSCVQIMRAWPSIWRLHCIYALQTRRRNVVELTYRRWPRAPKPDSRCWVSVSLRERMDGARVFLDLGSQCFVPFTSGRKSWALESQPKATYCQCQHAPAKYTNWNEGASNHTVDNPIKYAGQESEGGGTVDKLWS